jgi:hypothetical protein
MGSRYKLGFEKQSICKPGKEISGATVHRVVFSFALDGFLGRYSHTYLEAV